MRMISSRSASILILLQIIQLIQSFSFVFNIQSKIYYCNNMYRIASTSIVRSVRFGRPSFTCSTCLFATSQSGSDDHKKGKAMRVDRILVNRGMSGRKSIQKMMKEGRVFLVVDPDDSEKDVMISKGDIKIPEDSELVVDGYIIPQPPLALVYHKPKDVISAMKDSRYCLGDALQEKSPLLVNAGMHPVGRLDADTTGLILFSNSGALTQRLLHPRHEVEKEYVATVETMDGILDEEKLRNMLRSGVETTEGTHFAELLSAVVDDANHSQADVRIVVQEGKYRMVRRMLANCGYPVIELRRERHGNILLNDLPEGQFRQLDSTELDWVTSLLQQ